MGGPKFAEFGSDRTVELFCGKLLLTTRTTTCFSICERRSLLAQEILYCFAAERGKQIIGRYPKIITFFNIPEIYLSGK